MSELSASVLDYTNRSVDFLAFDDAELSREALLTQVLVKPGETGALIAGISKLVQRFLIELLTEQGTLVYAPDRGTVFMTAIRMGVINTSQDLFAAFSSAEAELRVKLKLEEEDTDPLDERYDFATLLSTSLFGDSATLTIQVNSRAGDSRTIIFPLRLTAI